MTLVEILEQFGLENETDKNSVHAYVEKFYEEAFKPYQNKKITLLEIGISLGASLKLWKEYFTNSVNIIGIDNREGFVAEKYKNIEGITHYYEDAYNPYIVDKLPKFNIIIDDGSHEIENQIKALQIYLPLLKKGGIYVIEDIQQQIYPDAYERLVDAIPESLKEKYQWLDLREYRNRPDDTLMVIRK